MGLVRPKTSRAGTLAAAAATVLVAVGLIAWLAWPSTPAVPGASRVRQYSDVRACLLTGSAGIANSQAANAWAGLQAVSLATKAMVSYQPAVGPPTAAATIPYLASLAQRQCRVIVAVGHGPVAAVGADAARFTQIRFVVVAGHASGPNVTAVSPAPAAQLRAAIRAAVSAAVS
jgi:hypothetical protein